MDTSTPRRREETAGSVVLAKELWETSLELCKKHVPEMEVRDDLLS